MRWSSVDLPLPDGPARATSSPAVIVSDTPRSAGTIVAPLRYDLATDFTSATGNVFMEPPRNAASGRFEKVRRALRA